MSLLDRGPHTVTVTPMVQTGRGRTNTPVLGLGEPVVVHGGMVQPVEAAESTTVTSSQVRTLYRWIGRGPWPGGPHSMVEWEGRKFDQVGEARIYGVGRRTRHVDVLLSARSAEVK